MNNFPLKKENYILLIVSFIFVVLGYLLMSGGGVAPSEFYPNGDSSLTPKIFNFTRLTLAPIIVLFGYTLTIFAILAKPESKIIKSIFRIKK
ncbi:MAG: DUF3098 domain-containing protein [Bacteroidales bacterium]|nr:DUF3098 domain-containing protein [Bacteroidales bacterium]